MTNEEIEKAIESGARNVFAQELTKEKYTKEAEEVRARARALHVWRASSDARARATHQLSLRFDKHCHVDKQLRVAVSETARNDASRPRT